MPVVAGIAGSSRMFARALGISLDKLVEKFSAAQSNLPDVREAEGHFSEYPKCYGAASPKPVLLVSAITRRKDPIYPAIVPATMVHMLLGAIPREGGLLQVIRSAVPNTVRVHLTPGETWRYHLSDACTYSPPRGT